MTEKKTETKTESTQLTVMQAICNGIELQAQNIASDLKESGIDPKRFIATAKLALQTHKQKDKLEKADRTSLYLAIRAAAQDGLMPDGREAALVIYKDTDTGKSTVNYQPMVLGIAKLLRKSGEVDDVGGFIVFENDSFVYHAGRDYMPNHTVDTEKVKGGWFGNRGAPIGAWAFVKLKNGEARISMLTKERIERISTRSKIRKNYSVTEGPDWEEWWIKTAIRNVAKLAPKTPQMERALERADQEFDFSQENVSYNDQPQPGPEQPKKQETKASQAVKDKGKAKEEPPPPEPEIKDNVIDGDGVEVSHNDEEPPI